MFVNPHRHLAIALTALVVWTGVERAAAAEEPAAEASVRDAGAASGAGPLSQEYAGFEAAPIGLAFGGASAGGPSRLQPGGGATLRFGRHRWRYGYLTPAEVGFFFSSQTILLHAQIEPGLVFPAPLNRLELGLGAGVGLLRIAYAPTGCDGSCAIGGVGPLLSPVVRYLVIDGPRMTVGASVRALIPMHVSPGDWFGYFTGGGQLVLAAIDVAFGASP